jgi:hypothetical protein
MISMYYLKILIIQQYSLKLVLLGFLFLSHSVNSQKHDTVYSTANNIRPKVLAEGIHPYLVYFKMEKNATRIQTQFWTRTIKSSELNRVSVIGITLGREDKDSIKRL